MDGVHQELIRLKQRVEEMAASYSCSPRRTPQHMAEGDSFFAKVVDAKAHLDSIQASLLTNEEARRNQRKGYSGTDFSAWASPPHVSQFLPHHGLSLPSAPLFWSLFNSLRTDVRSLDSRVGDLEQSVSNLEDRVDHCLDPLTPRSSAADIPAAPLFYDRQGPCTGPWQAGFGMCADEFAQYTGPTFRNAVDVHQKSVELDATFSGFDRFSAYGDNNPSNYYPIAPASDVLAPEGVAFRDKEISDLEELNRSTQDSLRRSEEASYERQSYIQELEATNVELQKKQVDCVAMFRDIFAEKHAEVQQARAERDARAEEHRDACQRLRANGEQLTKANQQLQHMCDQHSSKQGEFDEAIKVKDEELQRLREFCESKDAVIVKQEEVIARGVILMEQKDDEIERMTCDLKLCRDHLDREAREKERCWKVIEKRDEVVAQLRTSLNNALTPQSMRKRTPEAPTAASKAPYSPFATSGPELHAEHGEKWLPQRLSQGARLPSEQQRAAIWQSGPRSVSHTFGRSGWRQNSHDARLSDSVRLLERLAVTEESPPLNQDRPRAHQEKSSHVSRSSGGSSDPPSNTSQSGRLPPLPPRRRISLAGIHTTSKDRSEPITKHVSMQELPRSRLQPYVEAAEDEKRD